MTCSGTISFVDPGDVNVLFKCFRGRVIIAPIKTILNHPPSPDVFEKAENYVRLWPMVYNSFHQYVQYISPFECELYPDNCFVSSSGCSMEEFGIIHCTYRHPFCLAEAMVHEMAHMKLFSMGINYECATAIIKNDPNERFYSPIKECQRPMTAVFHAVYSFIHILYLNNLILKSDSENPDIPVFMLMAKDTLSKMKEGCKIISENIKTDRQGELFVRDFLDWATTTMSETKQILNNYAIEG